MAKETQLKEDFSDIYKAKEIEPGFLNKQKQNKYHFTDIDISVKPMRQADIGREISRVHDIPVDVVYEVINAYQDVMIREIIGKGRFKIPGILDVYSKLSNINRNEFEKVPNLEEDVYISPPVTVRPRVKINNNLKEDYKNARRYEEALNMKIEPEDWYKPFIIDEPERIEAIRKGVIAYHENKKK